MGDYGKDLASDGDGDKWPDRGKFVKKADTIAWRMLKRGFYFLKRSEWLPVSTRVRVRISFVFYEVN